MPKLETMTLQEFLKSGNSAAIKRYKLKGILPSYVKRPPAKGRGKGMMEMSRRKKDLAKMYGDPNKITRGDVIAAAVKKAKKKSKKKPKKTTPLKFVMRGMRGNR